MKRTKNDLRICVFPVAGIGSKFMPATKNTPKEMLPLIDRPIIHYGVSEAVDAGCKKIVFITGAAKGSIRDYFSPNPQLVAMLRSEGKEEAADAVAAISDMADFAYVGQPSPRGVGDAIRCAAAVCSGDAYFGIILPDDVMQGEKPALLELDEVRTAREGSVIALERVPEDQLSRYGVAETEEVAPGIHRIRALVEKPGPGAAASNLAIIGRYVLSSKIFRHLEALKPGAGGEYQLTDAINAMLAEEPVWGVECAATRYDCGTIPGWIKATGALVRRHPLYGHLFEDD
jgi:UDP-glucose pyrophosphorylase